MFPRHQDLPNGDAEGVFGVEDVIGTLNRQTPDTIAAAARLVRTGDLFSLNAPLEWPDPPLLSRRPLEHHVLTTPMGNRDDYLDSFYPQSSSQWDGLLHITDPDAGTYNRRPVDQLGIESWARRGIAGRGVLLDVQRWLGEQGEDLDWRARRPITVSDLEATRRWAGLEQREGDVLLVRTGWAAGYRTATLEDQAAARTRHDSPGLDASDEMAAYLWDWGLSAAASDNIGLEAMPIQGEMLHRKILVRLGMPIGELWWLDELAEHSAADGRWESLLVSAPLNLSGGIGSPANALALK